MWDDRGKIVIWERLEERQRSNKDWSFIWGGAIPLKFAKIYVPLKIFIRSQSLYVLACVSESSNFFSMGFIIISLNSFKWILWMLWNAVHVMVVCSEI